MRTKIREDSFVVRYKKKTDAHNNNTFPIYAPSKERALEVAVSFGVSTGREITGAEQIDFYVLRFGAVLPKTIYV